MRLLDIAVVSMLLAFALYGCQHVRTAAIVDVPGPSVAVQTKYRYSVKLRRDGSSYNGNLLFKLYQPCVFAEDGIPVIVAASICRRDSYGRSDAAKTAQFLLYMCSCGLAPIFNGYDAEESVSISIPLISNRQSGSLKIATQYDEALSIFSPIALCLKRGEPSFPRFDAGTSCVFKNNRDGIGSQFMQTRDSEALAYGIAFKLKEMEDSGLINESIVEKHKEQQRSMVAERSTAANKKILERNLNITMQKSTDATVAQPPYRIVHLERDGSSDFAYRFALELNGEPSIQTFFGIQKVFANEVRSAYQLEYPNADLRFLRVAVHPRLVNGRIEGRAEILTIAPLSLYYDPNTRRGKLAVKFNAGQAEEARAWIRKNIETLAQDKNIALRTGELPPVATYYSLGEKIEGNVMEIEFKTE